MALINFRQPILEPEQFFFSSHKIDSVPLMISITSGVWSGFECVMRSQCHICSFRDKQNIWSRMELFFLSRAGCEACVNFRSGFDSGLCLCWNTLPVSTWIWLTVLIEILRRFEYQVVRTHGFSFISIPIGTRNPSHTFLKDESSIRFNLQTNYRPSHCCSSSIDKQCIKSRIK